MRQPSSIARWIVEEVLGIEDASNNEIANVAKSIYSAQREGFIEGISQIQVDPKNLEVRPMDLWGATARKHKLNGRQARE